MLKYYVGGNVEDYFLDVRDNLRQIKQLMKVGDIKYQVVKN